MKDDTEFEHSLKNYIAIVLGYSDLLIADMAEDDPRRDDVTEIHKAAMSALKLIDGHKNSAG